MRFVLDSNKGVLNRLSVPFIGQRKGDHSAGALVAGLATEMQQQQSTINKVALMMAS